MKLFSTLGNGIRTRIIFVSFPNGYFKRLSFWGRPPRYEKLWGYKNILDRRERKKRREILELEKSI